MGKLLSILLIIACLAGGYVYWVTQDLPPMKQLLRDMERKPLSHYAQVFASDGSVIYSHGQFRHQKITLEDVAPQFIQALLITEDHRFFDHRGVDPVAVGRALFRNVGSKRLLEGGSTITQQVVRNLFLTNERSLSRKVREAVLAIQLENTLPKEDILELYLNTVYFGEGAYGLYAASEVYFNKKPSQLSLNECATLAGLPQAPSVYTPFQNPEAAKKRRNEVLAKMREAGVITQEEYKKTKESGWSLNRNGREMASGNRAPFFNRYVLKEIMERYDMDEQSFWQSGLRIYTTLDPAAQRLAEQSVRRMSAKYGRNGKKQQASLVALSPFTGAILAYVGGKSYRDSQFDRVSQSVRSPGSLFKIFTYTAALENGYPPTQVYVDEPVTYGNWTPQNYDKQHHGAMSLAQALAFSNNVIAVKVLKDVGADNVARLAHRMGIRSELDPNLSLTLGSSGVSLLDITAAMGVFVNHGVLARPYAVQKIKDASGYEIYDHRSEIRDVLKPSTADTMVAMLRGVMQFGTGVRGNIGRPIAGKTGTSDQHRDSWFVAFTPTVVTGVWVGNDDNTPMTSSISGGTLPADIWKTFMGPYVASIPAQDFNLAYSLPVKGETFGKFAWDNNPGSAEGGGQPSQELEVLGTEAAREEETWQMGAPIITPRPSPSEFQESPGPSSNPSLGPAQSPVLSPLRSAPVNPSGSFPAPVERTPASSPEGGGIRWRSAPQEPASAATGNNGNNAATAPVPLSPPLTAPAR